MWIHDFHGHIWILIWNLCQETSWYPRIRSFSWNHARNHEFWPFFMGAIKLEIMSEEDSEEYSAKYSDLMEFLRRILHWIYWRSEAWCVDAQYLTGPDHSAATAPEPPASLSACLYGRATVPIPATLVLSHTQLWLPARLAQHQLESQQPRCDLSADSESRHCRLPLTSSSSVQ